MSSWVKAILAAKNEVNPPISKIKNKTDGVNSNKGEHLIIKNTPAVTSVAACISAETGVGPSIAHGNHVCNPICADLPTDPINRKKQMTFKEKNSKPIIQKTISEKNEHNTKTIEKSTVLKKKKLKLNHIKNQNLLYDS